MHTSCFSISLSHTLFFNFSKCSFTVAVAMMTLPAGRSVQIAEHLGMLRNQLNASESPVRGKQMWMKQRQEGQR